MDTFIYNSGFVTLFFFSNLTYTLVVHFASDEKMQIEFKGLVQYV